MNVVLGSDVSLPCEYVLTPQEQQEANIFHLLTWTREQPFNSEHWAGLAVKSTLTGSKVIYDDPQHIFITNNTLQVTNVSVEDHTRYQCAFQSSFFSSPSTIELNVQCKYAKFQFYLKITLPFQSCYRSSCRPGLVCDFFLIIIIHAIFSEIALEHAIRGCSILCLCREAANSTLRHCLSHRIAVTTVLSIRRHYFFPCFYHCYLSRFVFAKIRLSTMILLTQTPCQR